MIKKLVRYGNSQAIVLDRAILELLGIQEGGEVKLSIEGGALVLRPVLATVDCKPVLKQPEIIAEMRKVHEEHAQRAREVGNAMRAILLSHAANPALMERLEGVQEAEVAIKALGDFAFQGSPEFKERMWSLVHEHASAMFRLHKDNGPMKQAEVEAWCRQEYDRTQEHLEEVKIKQERTYADIKKIVEKGLRDYQTFESLLTPEVMELIVSHIMNQLQAEAMIGKIN